MKKANVTSSKELLFVTGPTTGKQHLIKSLMKKKKLNKEKLETFKFNKSPIFDQLRNFLPEMQASTAALMKKSDAEKEELDIENVEGCKDVVEMNLLVGLPQNNCDSDASSDTSSDTSSDSDSESCDANPDPESVLGRLGDNESKNCSFNKRKLQIPSSITSHSLEKKLIVEINSNDDKDQISNTTSCNSSHSKHPTESPNKS